MCKICRQAAQDQANIDSTTADAVLKLTTAVSHLDNMNLTNQRDAVLRLLDIILPPAKVDVKEKPKANPVPEAEAEAVDPKVEAQREILAKATGIPIDMIRYMGGGLFTFGL